MKRYVIAGVVVLLIAAIIYAAPKAKQTIQRVRTAEAIASAAIGTAERYATMYQMVQSQLMVSSDSLRRLNRQAKIWQSQNKALLGDISHLKAEVASYVPDTVIVVRPPPVRPETLDSALIVIDQQQAHVVYQDTRIRSLTAINITQGVIIEKQDTVIDTQSLYIDQFETLIRQYERRSRRNIGIAFLLGYAAGKIF